MSATSQRANPNVTFAVLAAGVGAYALLQSLVTPVLSTIQRDLHTTQNTVTWVLTAYLLSASIFTPILGRIGDMVGKERMFVATLVALAIGSMLAALAPNITVLIIARAIQGIGGGVLPLAFGIVRDEFPPQRVASAVGLIAALIAVGGGLGIVLAGPIVDALDYHWLFWIPMVICAAAAIGAKLFIPESPVRTPGSINWLGAVLLSGWLVALLVGVSQAPSWGWTSGSVIGLMVVAVLLFAAWITAEMRAKDPLIDMRMMAIPAVWTTNLVALLFGVGMYSTFAFLPEFVQTPRSAGYGFSASITESGLLLLPMTVTMFIFGGLSGRIGDRIGAKAVLITGSAVSVLPFILLAFAHAHRWQVLLAMGIAGAGFGLAFAAMSGIVVAAVSAEQTGVASGMNANIRTIGGSIGAAVTASIVTSGAASNGLPREAGYTHAFIVLGCALAAAAVAGLLIPARVKAGRSQSKQPALAVAAAGASTTAAE